jgi:hypothetical protein
MVQGSGSFSGSDVESVCTEYSVAPSSAATLVLSSYFEFPHLTPQPGSHLIHKGLSESLVAIHVLETSDLAKASPRPSCQSMTCTGKNIAAPARLAYMCIALWRTACFSSSPLSEACASTQTDTGGGLFSRDDKLLQRAECLSKFHLWLVWSRYDHRRQECCPCSYSRPWLQQQAFFKNCCSLQLRRIEI